MRNHGTKIKPVTPDMVVAQKKESVPNEVLETFNELIAKGCSNSGATVYQKEVVALASQKLGIEPKQFDYRWLDIEDIYEEAGWKVTYDKPGFNETYYDAYFIFRPAKRSSK